MHNRVLLRTPTPYEDESLAGYLIRLNESNYYSSPKWILQLAGLHINCRIPLTNSLYEPSTLSQVIQVSDEQLKVMASLSNQLVGDVNSQQYAIYKYAKKLCPHCLTESAYCRKIWDWDLVTACYIHQCVLIKHCSNGALIKLIAGKILGYASPVKVFSPILYLDGVLSANAHFTIPTDYSERAVYSVTEGLRINDEPIEQYRLAILQPGEQIKVSATAAAQCIVIGGEPLGTRYKWWNFVFSRPERIEQAKADWRDCRFASVPDETEFIPLPEVVTEANPFS
jgi:hypothetical protein